MKNLDLLKFCNNIKEVIKYINSYSENSSDENLESIENFIQDFVYGGRKNSLNILEEYYNLIK